MTPLLDSSTAVTRSRAADQSRRAFLGRVSQGLAAWRLRPLCVRPTSLRHQQAEFGLAAVAATGQSRDLV